MSGPTFKLEVPARFAGGFLEAIAKFAGEERYHGKKSEYLGVVRLDGALRPHRTRASLSVGSRPVKIEQPLTRQLAGDLFAFSYWIRNNVRYGSIHDKPDWEVFIDNLRVELRAWLARSVIDHIAGIET